MKRFVLAALHVLRAEADKRSLKQKVVGTVARSRNAGYPTAPSGAAGDCRFHCDGCDCEFVPTPDSFILTGFVRLGGDNEDEECFLHKDGRWTRTELETLNEFELSELGLTEESCQSLLRGETVFTGADAFCDACRQEIFS